MDYVDALSKLLPVVKSLQEGGYDILHVSASRCSVHKTYVHIGAPSDRTLFVGLDAKVARKATNREYMVNMDGIDILWLEPIKDEPEVQTVTL